MQPMFWSPLSIGFRNLNTWAWVVGGDSLSEGNQRLFPALGHT